MPIRTCCKNLAQLSRSRGQLIVSEGCCPDYIPKLQIGLHKVGLSTWTNRNDFSTSQRVLRRQCRLLAASICSKALILALVCSISHLPQIIATSQSSNRAGGQKQLSPVASDQPQVIVSATAVNGRLWPIESASKNIKIELQDQMHGLAKAQRPAELTDWLLICCMSAIIASNVCGNSLAILSVCRYSKSRVAANWLIVSLACADILVALLAMSFSASVVVSGRWLFEPWLCDIWNSSDVFASTASILHLCCISIDRYVAITRPLEYHAELTTRRVMYALGGVWMSSALISYVPILTGAYTTQEHIEWRRNNPDECQFVANRVYAVISALISFWIPSSIMTFAYWHIYKVADREEKLIYMAQGSITATMIDHQKQQTVVNPSNQCEMNIQRPVHTSTSNNMYRIGPNTVILKVTDKARCYLLPQSAEQTKPEAEFSLSRSSAGSKSKQASSKTADQSSNSRTDKQTSAELAPPENSNHRQCCEPAHSNERCASTKQRREHKAAKTLGIVVGAFIICWLPFFSWYTLQHLCGQLCNQTAPRPLITLLTWFGYLNSALNPIIYAYFNRELREAFKQTLHWIGCCCSCCCCCKDHECLRVDRTNYDQCYAYTCHSRKKAGSLESSV